MFYSDNQWESWVMMLLTHRHTDTRTQPFIVKDIANLSHPVPRSRGRSFPRHVCGWRQTWPRSQSKTLVVSRYRDEYPFAKLLSLSFQQNVTFTQSRIRTRLLNNLRYCFAAMATLLKKQKPRGWSCSAWWPGGRTRAIPLRRTPAPTVATQNKH